MQGTDFDVPMKKVDLDASSIFVIQYDQNKICAKDANAIYQAARRTVGGHKVLMIPDVCRIEKWSKQELIMVRDCIDRFMAMMDGEL